MFGLESPTVTETGSTEMINYVIKRTAPDGSFGYLEGNRDDFCTAAEATEFSFEETMSIVDIDDNPWTARDVAQGYVYTVLEINCLEDFDRL